MNIVTMPKNLGGTIMSYALRSLLALAVVAGVAVAPTASWAASDSKSDGASAEKKAAVDEFEENRKAHTAKSKENNMKKGAE